MAQPLVGSLNFEGSQWDGSELQNGTPRSVNDGESAFGDDVAEGDVGMELSAALNDEHLLPHLHHPLNVLPSLLVCKSKHI
jgi:hypothetical protein